MDVATGELTVRATGGDNFLGGTNFDKKLYDRFVTDFNRETGIDLDDPAQVEFTDLARIAQDWLQRAERLKRDLTLRPRASTSLTAMGKTIRAEVRRDEFEQMSRVLVQEIEDKIQETLRDADMAPNAIDMVLLVGGSTRMPMIRERVAQIFGKTPNLSISPDEAVALGASLYSVNRALNEGKVLHMPENRLRHLKDLVVTDVAAHSMGIEAFNRQPSQGGTLQHTILLRRNTPLPLSESHLFFTAYPNQTSVRIRVLEGEDEDIELCTQIGEFLVTDLPPRRATGMPLDVTMHYNRNGILEVEAIDQSTGTSATVRIDRAGSLSEEEEAEARSVVKEMVVE